MIASPLPVAPSSLLRPPDPAKAAPPVPQPPRPLHITIDGELLEDAQMRLERGTHRPTVLLLLGQGAGAPPVRVLEVFGSGDDAAMAAAEKARTLIAGRRVRVRGEGLIMRWNRGEFWLSVARVERVGLLDGGAA